MDELIDQILAELERARAKFPGANATFAALVEEVGELGKALMEEPRANVRNEAVQVAVMAMRVILDGDQTFDAWRAAKNLDPLSFGAPKSPLELAIEMRAAQEKYFRVQSRDNLLAAKNAERAFDKAMGLK